MLQRLQFPINFTNSVIAPDFPSCRAVACEMKWLASIPQGKQNFCLQQILAPNSLTQESNHSTQSARILEGNRAEERGFYLISGTKQQLGCQLQKEKFNANMKNNSWNFI